MVSLKTEMSEESVFIFIPGVGYRADLDCPQQPTVIYNINSPFPLNLLSLYLVLRGWKGRMGWIRVVEKGTYKVAKVCLPSAG